MSYSSKRTANHRRGFSLMELMVVIVIIGLLAGAVTVSVRGYLATARKGVAKTEIIKIVEGLETFNALQARYPTQEEGIDILLQPLADFSNGILKKQKLDDPWGNPYQYIVSNSGTEPFEVISNGPDAREGTADDISSLNLEGEED